MSGNHSVLSPSASEMWARCPGSLLLGKGAPDVDKEYNASGTCSHWMLERALAHGIAPENWLGQTLKFGEFEFKIDEDRIGRVRSVVDNLAREPGTMWVEKLVNMAPIFNRPGQVGHADVVKLHETGVVEMPNGDRLVGVLSVHDFKDGYIRVDAEGNMQGLSYCAGLLYEMDLLTEINAIRFCIHQPKINHYDEVIYTREQIATFIAVIRPMAELAYDLYHNVVPFDVAKHLNAGEEQCFWCPVRGSCPARAQRVVQLFAQAIPNCAIDDEHLGRMCANLDEIEQACKDYRSEASKRAKNGRRIPGWKLVKGKRPARKWKDKAKAEQSLQLVLSPEQVYQPREIISPTVAEEVAGVEGYAALRSLVDYGVAGVTLVPESDKRPEVKMEEFKPVEAS